jgi:hypothetical protein
MALTLQFHNIARIELSEPNTIHYGNGATFVTRKMTVVDGLGSTTELTLFGLCDKALTVLDPWKDEQDAADVEAFIVESDEAARRASHAFDVPAGREHII